MHVLRHYLIMWMFFIVLFSAAVWGLELLEGNKITTTEYYGLRNIGYIFLAVHSLIAVVMYPIALWPLSLIIRKIVTTPLGQVLIYTVLGGLSGMLIFHNMYDDYFVQGYQLNRSSAMVIFGAFGLVYAIMDRFFASILFNKMKLLP